MRLIDSDKLKQDLLDRSFYPAIVARAIDNAPTVNTYEWISVEDRLPEDESDVLCWYEYFRYGDYNRMYQTYGIGKYDTFCKCWCGEVAVGHGTCVIAWMPLPASPTENQIINYRLRAIKHSQ